MINVFIMRGIPGSGKSTWIEKHQKVNCNISRYTFSADNFFIDNEGKYNYDPSKIGIAHNWCMEQYLFCICNTTGSNKNIYVDNTNICQYEVAPYYRVAESLGYNVKIVTLHCPILAAQLRGIHSVSTEVIGKMYQNLMTTWLPTWWNQEIIPYDDQDGMKVQCCLCGAMIASSLLHCHCQIGKMKSSDFMKG